MPRLLVPLLAAIIAAPAMLASSAFAEAGGQPGGQPIPIQITPPKTNVTIRSITLDAAGAVTADGQKTLDQMIEEGWRAMSITNVSTGQPVTLAVLFARTARPPGPPPGMAPPAGGPPAGAPPALPPGVAPRPPQTPPPANEHNP